MTTGILHFIKAKREEIDGDKNGVRIVYQSRLIKDNDGIEIDEFLADRAPLFYRSLDKIMADLQDGYFLTAFKSTLDKLPTCTSFQESHFGEIVAGIFAEEVMGLRRIYSKLTFLTAENANAYKMDLVMYDPKEDPVKIVFGEVKCSPKSAIPAGHDKSCYPDLFNSLKKYSEGDKTFDLTAARDSLSHLQKKERKKVRKALMPYSGSIISYAGFAIIDSQTYSKEEVQVLRTRKSEKEFEVDLICMESYSLVAGNVFAALQNHAGHNKDG